VSRHELKYSVEVVVATSSGDGATAEAYLCDRYEIGGDRKATIAEALRALADELDGENE
jgi:hypothetical protein